MQKLKDIWGFLNGRKTLIGGFLAALYVFGVDYDLFSANTGVETAIEWIFGIGVVHKVIKQVR